MRFLGGASTNPFFPGIDSCQPYRLILDTSCSPYMIFHHLSYCCCCPRLVLNIMASTSSQEASNSLSLAKQQEDFAFPPHYSFPPFYTLQPNATTRASQLASWSSLILDYFAHHWLFKITPSHPIFTSPKLRRSLAPTDARQVLEHLAQRGRLEWIESGSTNSGRGFWGDQSNDNKSCIVQGSEGSEAWVWWQTSEEWASQLATWVEKTGQQNRVLTLYELLEGESTRGQPFHSLPAEMAEKCINVLSRRGKASLIGEGKDAGAKFF